MRQLRTLKYRKWKADWLVTQDWSNEVTFRKSNQGPAFPDYQFSNRE